jgi:RNA polymerase sigma-70 factor (ECF subfamily)
MFRRLQREPEQELMSDADLHRASLDGSRHGGGEQALAELYRRHGTLIYRYSLRMCQDPSIAEEVTQEVFLALLRQGERYDAERSALSTWLCGIARRQVWKHLEKRQRDLPVELSDLNGNEDGDGERYQAESPDDDPADVLSRKDGPR